MLFKTITVLLFATFVIESISHSPRCPHSTFARKHLCIGTEITPEKAAKCAQESNKFRKSKDMATSGDLTIFFSNGAYFETEVAEGKEECVSHNIPQFCCKRVPNQPWKCQRDGSGNAAHFKRDGHAQKFHPCKFDY